jgi:hypothetical protein
VRTRRLLLSLLPIVVACGGAAFSAGPDDGGPDSGPDGGSDVATGGDSSSTHDAITPSDGPLDAIVPPPADAGRFCTTTGASHTFCDDFDDRPASDVQGAWDEALTTNGATLALGSSSFTSPPRALLAQLPIIASSSDLVAGVRKGFGTKVAAIEFAFDVVVDAYGATTNAGGAAIALVDVGPLTYTLVVDDPSHSSFQEGFQTAPDAQGTPVVHAIHGGLPIDVWGRVDCTLTFMEGTTAGQIVITYTVNGATTKLLDEMLQPVQAAPGTLTRLRIGAGAHQPASPWVIRYDDVTVDVH